jgi:hypothetical protein
MGDPKIPFIRRLANLPIIPPSREKLPQRGPAVARAEKIWLNAGKSAR